MEYIYHLVPEQLHGTSLMPLSALRANAPTTYALQVAKYEDHPDRKKLPSLVIPKLNCTRADVIHFSPLHPFRIYEGYKSVFGDVSFGLRFFVIPIERLKGTSAVYFDVAHRDYHFGIDPIQQETFFKLITIRDYRELKNHPERNLEFYNLWKAQGKNGAPLYAHIPHVMVKGIVDVTGCVIVDWREPIALLE